LALPDPAELLAGVVAVHREQQRRLGGLGGLGGMGLLVAAPSAGALAAVEMAAAGLPWRPEVHDAVLTELLGSRPRAGAAPRVLQELAAKIEAAVGGQAPNPGPARRGTAGC